LFEKTKNRLLNLAIFVAGGLNILCFAPYYQSWYLFLSLSFLLIVNDTASSKRQAFCRGWLFGAGFFSVGLYWINNALLVRGEEFVYLYPFAIIIFGVVLGLFTALNCLLIYKSKNSVQKWIVASCLWALLEWLRSWIFTGLPFVLLAYIWGWSLPVMQFSYLGGPFLLSFITFAVFSTPYILWRNKNAKTGLTLFAFSLIVICVVWGYGYLRIKNTPLEPSEIKVRIVQPSIPQEEKWSPRNRYANFMKHVDLSASLGKDDVSYVIWGETAVPFAFDKDDLFLSLVKQAVPKNGWLITGAPRVEFDDNDKFKSAYNSMFVINDKGEIDAVYDKKHLVPFGEYVPFKEYIPLKKITNGLMDFSKGEKPRIVSVNNKNFTNFYALICYEIIFPNEFSDNHNDRAKWAVNITNDGWYGKRIGPFQHLDTARFRAIEQGVTIVRVANTGVSSFISPLGAVYDSIGLYEASYIDGVVDAPVIEGIYAKYGNILFLLVVIFLLLPPYLDIYNIKVVPQDILKLCVKLLHKIGVQN